MLLSLALLVGLLVIAAYTLFVYRQHRKFSEIPGPPRPSFFLGHLRILTAAIKKGPTFAELMSHWHLNYGYTFVIFISHKHFISCIDPEIIKHVLLQHPRAFPKATFYNYVGFIFGERGLGEGLVTQTDYDKWAVQRMALNPAFHRKYLIGLVSVFNATALELTDVLGECAGSGCSVDLCIYFHKAANDVISQLAFGKPPGNLREDSSLYFAAKGLLAGISLIFLSAFPEWSPLLLRERREYRHHVRAIKAMATEVIRERLENLRNDQDIPDDILSTMVKAHVENSQFTMEIMLDNMVTFFVAGQETSASALAFMFAELGRNPEVLQKAQNEVMTCIGDKAFISYEDAASLKYCTMVIKETLRLYPVGLGTSRHIAETTIYGSIRFPAGCDVNFTSFSSGRHPDLFEDPEKFNPERFDPDHEDRVPQTAYFPFALGPRSCIGQNFAMIEMKIFLAKFLQRFEYRLDNSHPFVLGQSGTLHPKNGVWATLINR